MTHLKYLFFCFIAWAFLFHGKVFAQSPAGVEWIRPDSGNDPAVWGIKNGIVLGLWPAPIEERGNSIGGPRGLFRMGYESNGKIDHINYIAVEPVVDDVMEFSEISPSRIDGKWGKLMWASSSKNPGSYFPSAGTKGDISHPDPQNPKVEQLSFYVHMEKFNNGAHPYLKISIRSDRPEEVIFEIFQEKDSKKMQRCVLTATMGNYVRARKLYLKNRIINSKKLYEGYDGIDFIEKDSYPLDELYRNKDGDVLAIIECDESFNQLASWPQHQKENWRYRPSYKVNQYWKKSYNEADESLRIRVNGRAAYWAGGSRNKEDYIYIPNGPAFENFEMREDFHPGQKFIFGISRDSVEEISKR